MRKKTLQVLIIIFFLFARGIREALSADEIKSGSC